MRIDGNTRIVGIFGDPIAHTLSPRMHNAAFQSLNLNYVYVPFRVRREELAEATAAIKALNLAGINVTVPHKEAIIPYLDELEEEARLIGAVNTVINQGGKLWGSNTDASGFLAALQEEGFAPAKKKVAVLGAGGAARAVGVALARSQVEEIIFFNRTFDRAAELAAYLEERTGVRTRALPWEEMGSSKGIELLQAADLIVQTTSLGMYPCEGEMPPVAGEAFRPGQLVIDLIYRPLETRFLSLARKRGAKTASGLGMLLYQGALAFSLWTGVPAPLEVMRAALEEALGVGQGRGEDA
ncbi:shikimate dehydrogenase [Ammonifex thiophilus]|uniref:Shikimate dehydrogenase (NADP(+)) n=1 Tax=Ammonifex thiophilus TaxID=444093 RepID=A0A3D8P1N3_9THEO|nr:shikimate dehydrogenase [Ammonifex thiophilus]RDV81745.1 shikimate dehydrogenase [Ammonifex thiophilus]